MGATNLCAVCDRHRTRQCTRHTAPIQFVRDFFGAISAGFVQPFEMTRHSRGSGIKTKPDNVDTYPTPLTRELDATDQFQSQWH